MNKDTKIIKAISITMLILMFVALSITFWVLDTRYLDDIQCSVLYLIYTAVMWISMEIIVAKNILIPRIVWAIVQNVENLYQ